MSKQNLISKIIIYLSTYLSYLKKKDCISQTIAITPSIRQINSYKISHTNCLYIYILIILLTKYFYNVIVKYIS